MFYLYKVITDFQKTLKTVKDSNIHYVGRVLSFNKNLLNTNYVPCMHCTGHYADLQIRGQNLQ